jgi:hypothetical protein
MLITPAIASEPYWAAAPSRSTSMWWIADSGIALMSVPAEPRPMVCWTLTSACWWRRLPLTSTSNWSGRASAGWRADDVGAVADEGGREVERRVERLQQLAQFQRTGHLHVLGADQADRRAVSSAVLAPPSASRAPQPFVRWPARCCRYSTARWPGPPSAAG